MDDLTEAVRDIMAVNAGMEKEIVEMTIVEIRKAQSDERARAVLMDILSRANKGVFRNSIEEGI